MAADLQTLAELSHGLERIALSLAADGIDRRVVAVEIEERCGGQREALAIALSYLLRRRTLGTETEPAVLDAAVDAVVAALRRTGGDAGLGGGGR